MHASMVIHTQSLYNKKNERVYNMANRMKQLKLQFTWKIQNLKKFKKQRSNKHQIQILNTVTNHPLT
jgi:hypothetical protein